MHVRTVLCANVHLKHQMKILVPIQSALLGNDLTKNHSMLYVFIAVIFVTFVISQSHLTIPIQVTQRTEEEAAWSQQGATSPRDHAGAT